MFWETCDGQVLGSVFGTVILVGLWSFFRESISFCSVLSLPSRIYYSLDVIVFPPSSIV